VKIAVLVSGSGSNLQAIIDAASAAELCGAEVSLVISSKEDAYALERAKKSGIKTALAKESESLLALLAEEAPDLVVLAGYMRILPPEVVRAFPRRIINIHPSLIPKYCGIGYYGIKVHEAALAAGEKVTRIRRLASSVWVVFNLVPHSLQPLAKTSLDALAFCRTVGEVPHRERLEFRIGVAMEAEGRAGVVSKDRLLYDFYGQAMVTAATLARRASPGTVLIVPDVAQFDRSRTLTVAQLALVDVSEEFYEMRIE
jgi:hypothetical protein